jgi:hypothetical protein
MVRLATAPVKGDTTGRRRVKHPQQSRILVGVRPDERCPLGLKGQPSRKRSPPCESQAYASAPLLPIKLTPQLAAIVMTAAVQPSLINGRERPVAAGHRLTEQPFKTEPHPPERPRLEREQFV